MTYIVNEKKKHTCIPEEVKILPKHWEVYCEIKEKNMLTNAYTRNLQKPISFSIWYKNRFKFRNLCPLCQDYIVISMLNKALKRMRKHFTKKSRFFFLIIDEDGVSRIMVFAHMKVIKFYTEAQKFITDGTINLNSYTPFI